MRLPLFYLLSLGFSAPVFAQNGPGKTPFELDNKQTATYEQCIQFYQSLTDISPMIKFMEAGATDSGKPLHFFIFSKSGEFDPVKLREQGKRIIFINNGIHPGEPEGIDATMMLLRDYLQSNEKMEMLENVVLVGIPIYNVGGALNRNSHSRTNQNGPASYGFRGNAKNLDLNRDFIKCDSRNAQSFNQLFAAWQPDVLVDNHTSNGADYQYTLTLLATQKDKLETPLADYLTNGILPKLYENMKKRGWEMCPYVNARETPDEGIYGFLDLPRFATGYAALHQTLGFTVETHMLKPFPDRVWATYHFMDALIALVHKDAKSIALTREKAKLAARNKQKFDLAWTVDKDKEDKFLFKGYEAKYKPSEVSGLQRLYYDRQAPYEKEIPFWNTFKPSLTVEKPVAYIIPQAYEAVAERLRWNGAEVKRLAKDALLECAFYTIKNYETAKNAYEGHYLHSKVEVEKTTKTRQFYAGDYVVFADQPINRYIVETLEPQAPDSYFAWNFFDGILMQKEYFSDYVFEDLAAQYLKENPDLKARLEKKKLDDPEFAKDAGAQLEFVYKNSPHYEPTHQLYPVGRLEKYVDLMIR